MRNLLKKFLFPAQAAALATTLLFAPALASAKDILPANVKPVKLWDLRDIYGDKTWRWTRGGGRFEVKEHKFLGWSAEGGKSTFGEGYWSVNNDGILCFKATWVAADGKGKARTCFEHVRDRGTIYQRKLPDGKWYIFKHYRNKRSDEIRKITRRDTVTKNVERLKMRFE